MNAFVASTASLLVSGMGKQSNSAAICSFTANQTAAILSPADKPKHCEFPSNSGTDPTMRNIPPLRNIPKGSMWLYGMFMDLKGVNYCVYHNFVFYVST